MEAFSKRMIVKRIGLTYIIQIAFKSPNPDRAAQIANAIAEAYIDDQLQAKYQATRRASVWLQAVSQNCVSNHLTPNALLLSSKQKTTLLAPEVGPAAAF